jgi:ABC-2 type transport system ATP-binding protein
MAGQGEGMLRFDRATVERAGEVIVERVTLEVRPGEALAIIGRDGSGKTALLEAAATAQRLHGGDILVAEASIRDDPEGVRRRIGYVPGAMPDWPGVRAGEFLEVFGVAAGLGGGALTAAVERGLRRAGLGADGRQRVDRLSRGRARRLLVARALLHEPEVLLLDDPFAGLDPRERDAIERLVEDTHLVGHVVVATIRDAVVPPCFTHLAVMAEGRLRTVAPHAPAAFATGRQWTHRIVCPGRGSDAALLLERDVTVLSRDADAVDCRHDPDTGPFAAIIARLVQAGIAVEAAAFAPPWQAQLLDD